MIPFLWLFLAYKEVRFGMDRQFIFNQIDDENYSGLITVLDPKMVVINELQKLSFPIRRENHKKLLIDLKRKIGNSEFRFLSIDVNDNGKVVSTSGKYELKVDEKLIVLANDILSQNIDN